jgi:hypothetical protein
MTEVPGGLCNKHCDEDKRFAGYIPMDKRVISSTDGMMNVIKPRTFGKKIGQRKRKINERTTTFR